MGKQVPERVAWAVEMLEVGPSDRVLEIGCGPGVSVALIAEKLADGQITAVDRSEIAIGRAMGRTRETVAAGKVVLKTAPLAEVDLGDATFDKVFAVRVNAFWFSPGKELSVVRRHLAPGGALYLFYDPPKASSLPGTLARLAANLEAGGFRVRRTLTEERVSGTFLSVIAEPSPGGPAARS